MIHTHSISLHSNPLHSRCNALLSTLCCYLIAGISGTINHGQDIAARVVDKLSDVLHRARVEGDHKTCYNTAMMMGKQVLLIILLL